MPKYKILGDSVYTHGLPEHLFGRWQKRYAFGRWEIFRTVGHPSEEGTQTIEIICECTSSNNADKILILLLHGK